MTSLMNDTITDTITDVATHRHRVTDSALDPDLDRISAQRFRLSTRHSQALTGLMGEREDLRGVHAMADFVDDAVRWTA